jgi:hypothetical protein
LIAAYFSQVKLNHDVHEFIHDSGTVTNNYFSLPSLYLALARAGEEEGEGVVKNLKMVLFIEKNA